MPADDLDLFEQPADELPSDDDLFGTPAEDAADAVDDTFDPGDFESDADAPAFEEPATDEQPGDESTDSLDDLFGATEASTDTTARTDAAATDPTAGGDLFQDPLVAPADSKPNEETTADELDDLFGARPAQTVRTQTVTTPSSSCRFANGRTTPDEFTTTARLASVTETHVRLLKDNGRYSTVSKRRLSQDDLTYVSQMTEQFGRQDFDQVADARRFDARGSTQRIRLKGEAMTASPFSLREHRRRTLTDDSTITLAVFVECDTSLSEVRSCELGEQLAANLEQVRLECTNDRRPRVYFEEWNSPLITGIGWVSELIEIAGGTDVFADLSGESLAKNRIVADAKEVVRRSPDIIIGSWCGKPFRPTEVQGATGVGVDSRGAAPRYLRN